MKVKAIVDEVFQDYKKPSMMIATTRCNWKCCLELGLDVGICQNSDIAKQKDVEVSADIIISRYLANPLTKAIVFGGLEPMLQFDEIYDFISLFREQSCDDIVIYTGYYPEELEHTIEILKRFKNIIVKFGRFIPNTPSRYDDVLGIELNSNNQFAERIS